MLALATEPHGARATYQAGCRCTPCRVANATYSQAHQPADWTTATQAQAHLRALMAQGVGIRRAADLSGLSCAHLQRIRNGQQATVKRTTEQTVLAIRPSLAHGQRVNGYRTRHLLRALKGEWFTARAIACRLGLRGNRLRLHHPRVTVRNALKVRQLYQQVVAE
ncbi:MAG TPA: hypothetical protein VNJ04_11995 [Gemmatimonadaceae bacterium]|nr:hypothetical protein [Gemmatimonadaceae bacterium]